MLTVGIPKEIKPLEMRVGLTPQGVGRLVGEGVPVFVQKDAGIDSGFSNEDYKAAGARIVATDRELYQKAGLIKKVKEPLDSEYFLLRPKQIIFSFLHLAAPQNRLLVKALIKSGATAIGYETIELNGRMPLLSPMSEIAGALAASYAALIRRERAALIKRGSVALPKHFLKSLELLAQVYPAYPSGLNIGNTIIFGGGAAGKKALEFALNLEGQVTVVEQSALRRAEIKRQWESKSGSLKVIGPQNVTEHILAQADVFIGCVHRTGERAEQVISQEKLKKVSAKKKKVIIDIAIDQGGNFPESRPTTYGAPLYLDSCGNIRFAVANIPSLCGKGASEAITESSVSYTIALARNFSQALHDFPELREGINVRAGKIVHLAVKAAVMTARDKGQVFLA